MKRARLIDLRAMRQTSVVLLYALVRTGETREARADNQPVMKRTLSRKCRVAIL